MLLSFEMPSYLITLNKQVGELFISGVLQSSFSEQLRLSQRDDDNSFHSHSIKAASALRCHGLSVLPYWAQDAGLEAGDRPALHPVPLQASGTPLPTSSPCFGKQKQNVEWIFLTFFFLLSDFLIHVRVLGWRMGSSNFIYISVLIVAKG